MCACLSFTKSDPEVGWKRSIDGRGGVKHLKENKDHSKCIVNA